MNKSIKLILLLIVPCITFGVPLQGYEICLKQQAFVHNGYVCLGDLAEIRAEDPELIKKLDDIVVGTAPDEGLVRYFSIYNILGALRREMINTDMLTFTGARHTKVEKDESGNPSDSAGAVHISLRETARITVEMITLGDILDIKTSDTETKESLSSIIVDKNPMPGFSKEFSKHDILRLLRKNKIEIRNIIFSENDSVKVICPSVTISGDEITEKARSFILKYFGWTSENTSVYLKNRISDIVLPEGAVDFQFIPVSGKSLGAITLEARVMLDNRFFKSYRLDFFIRHFADVWVASGSIAKGDIISGDDITLTKRNITLSPELENIKRLDLEGKTALKSIQAGMPVTLKMVEYPVLIKRGQLVKIEFKTGVLSIATSGRAMDNGRIGEIIRVKNMDTEKVISGTVLNSQKISVRL